MLRTSLIPWLQNEAATPISCLHSCHAAIQDLVHKYWICGSIQLYSKQQCTNARHHLHAHLADSWYSDVPTLACTATLMSKLLPDTPSRIFSRRINAHMKPAILDAHIRTEVGYIYVRKCTLACMLNYIVNSTLTYDLYLHTSNCWTNHQWQLVIISNQMAVEMAGSCHE